MPTTISEYDKLSTDGSGNVLGAPGKPLASNTVTPDATGTQKVTLNAATKFVRIASSIDVRVAQGTGVSVNSPLYFASAAEFISTPNKGERDLYYRTA